MDLLPFLRVSNVVLKFLKGLPIETAAMSSSPASFVSSTSSSIPHLHRRSAASLAEEIAILLGDETGLRHIRSQVERIGPHFRLALISGEIGAGKEQVARCLHLASPGAEGPFVVVRTEDLENASIAGAGGLTATISELDDLLESSRGGTLFLDEIANLSLAGQDALLQLLDRQARSRGLRDGRIIAGTVRSLRTMAASGAFRQDLLYRISTVEITVPSLRERKADIPGLAHRFLERFSKLYGKSVQSLSRDALDMLCRQEWPGNVRELENLIRNAVTQCDGSRLDASHLRSLPGALPGATEFQSASPRSVRLQDVVEGHVLEILRRCDGNKLRAAELLGISRSTLYRMLDSVAAAAREA